MSEMVTIQVEADSYNKLRVACQLFAIPLTDAIAAAFIHAEGVIMSRERQERRPSLEIIMGPLLPKSLLDEG